MLCNMYLLLYFKLNSFFPKPAIRGGLLTSNLAVGTYWVEYQLDWVLFIVVVRIGPGVLEIDKKNVIYGLSFLLN